MGMSVLLVCQRVYLSVRVSGCQWVWVSVRVVSVCDIVWGFHCVIVLAMWISVCEGVDVCGLSVRVDVSACGCQFVWVSACVGPSHVGISVWGCQCVWMLVCVCISACGS